MIIRASRDLPPDTEVVFEYRSPDTDDYGEFQNKLQHWGFKCDYKMCEEHSKTKKSTRTQRKVLRANAMAAIKSGNATRIDAVMKDFEKTYTSQVLIYLVLKSGLFNLVLQRCISRLVGKR